MAPPPRLPQSSYAGGNKIFVLPLVKRSEGSKYSKTAEAFPEELNDPESPDYSRRVISILLLGTRWQFDTYGLSTINKSLVNNLRLVDPEGKTIKDHKRP